MRTQRVRRTARRRVSAQPPARPRFGLSTKGKALAGLGALALILGLGSTTALGEATLSAAVAAASDQADLIRARSPGARTEANMTKGKPRLAARALPAARDSRGSIAAHLPGALPGPIAAPAAVASPALVVPPEIANGGVILPAGVPFGGGVFGGGPGGFFGPIGAIGGPGIGGGGGAIIVAPPGAAGTTPVAETPGPEVTTPPVAAPIPEPAGWALMILGFGVAGSALRKRSRSVPCASPARP